MYNTDIIAKELIYKEEEYGRFKTSYLMIDYLYSGTENLKIFLEKGYKNIGIYGAGVLARCLYDCIKKIEPSISIQIFDKNGQSKYFYDKKVCYISDEVQLDAIIITPIFSSQPIYENLKRLGFHNIYSLIDLVDNGKDLLNDE